MQEGPEKPLLRAELCTSKSTADISLRGSYIAAAHWEVDILDHAYVATKRSLFPQQHI